MSFFKKLSALNNLRHALNISKRQGALLLFFSIGTALSEGFGMASLLPLLQYVERGDKIMQGENVSSLWRLLDFLFHSLHLPINLITLLIFCFSPILIRQIFFYAYYVHTAILHQRSTAYLRTKSFLNMMFADFSFFESHGMGRLSSIFTLEATRAGDSVFLVFQLISAVFLLSFYVAFLGYLSLPLTGLAFLSFILIELLIHRQMMLTKHCGAMVSKSNDDLAAFVDERLSGIRLIKLNKVEEQEIESMRRHANALASHQINLQRKYVAVQALVEPTLVLGTFFILYIAVSWQGMTLASLSVFLFTLLRILPITKAANSHRQQILGNQASLNNVTGINLAAQEQNTIKSGKGLFEGLKENIRFDNVSFNYTFDRPVLKEISFVIPARKTTAIIGPSGVGKSTIVDLIVRLREVQSGRILFDEVPIREFDLVSFRRSMSFVSQDSFLFNDTVYNNIVYGLVDADFKQVLEATRLSHAHEFISQLPHGYESYVGDRGGRLSGGERQRLCLARAILRKPDILILDEPTSALDSESEQFIQETISLIRKEMTIIIIAHRLSTVKDADQILVVENGQIKETGNHEKLVSTEGLYKKLFRLQS